MRALIVCGGTPPSKSLIESEINAANLIVGADSGGHAILGHGFTPDIVLGDLDSFHYTNHEGIQTLEIEDQDFNDLEKALQYALDKGSKDVVILGALGKRVDHQMKNLSAMVAYYQKFNSLIIRDDYGDTLCVSSPYSVQLPVNTVISFFPLSGIVKSFSSEGVQYPLSNTDLIPGIQDGTSNTVTDETVTISYDEGTLGVFIGTGKKTK